MNKRNLVFILLLMAIGLSACSNKTSTEEGMEIDNNPSSTQHLQTDENFTIPPSTNVDESSVLGENISEPSVAESSYNNQNIKFTDGTGITEPVILKVGDSFLDWKVTSSEYPLIDSVKTSFEGTIRVKGTLAISPGDYWDNQLRFFITDDEYAKMFPCVVNDERVVWFLLNDTENARELFEAVQSMNPNPENYFEIEDCEIIIKDYFYIYYPAGVANSADLVEIICIP